MMESIVLAVGFWGLTIYLAWNTRKLDRVNRSIQGGQLSQSVSRLRVVGFFIIGVVLVTLIFGSSALVDGVSPFDYIQNILPKQIPEQPVMQPPKSKETIIPMPTATAIPTAIATPAIDDGDKTPGWMKTPGGQGGGQFPTPPGQGGTPPGQQNNPTNEPNQPKPTKDNSNSGDGSSKQ